MKENNYLDSAEAKHSVSRQSHWDAVARKRDSWQGMGKWYHQRLEKIYRFLISPGQRVLEIGSRTGDLLTAVNPEHGIGIDFSIEMISRAKRQYPEIEFIEADTHNLANIKGPFDAIILSDLVNELWDVQQVFEQLIPLCTPRTRIILNFYSRLWEFPLHITQLLNLGTPTLAQNWLTRQDVTNMLNLAGFETIRSWQEVLWPLPLGNFFNKFLVRLWPFREFALSNFMIARPQPKNTKKKPVVSVIIPARNETGNIKAIFERVPKMGQESELIFVEGHSQDDTFDTIKKEIASHPSTRSLLLQQPGIGKADAVRLGFERARGDILMILDADLTVSPRRFAPLL